ncbi:MAG TPA: hypothetical protein VK573_02990 [Gemmatimonadales bacterium]|nr:hypothetical protein [Gemmatimonadales bacterium]
MTTEMVEARAQLRRWRDNPVAFVRENFSAEPDAWQHDALMAYGQPQTQRLAMKACKGPGKTCVLSWIILHFLSTHPQAKVAATSITGDNLNDNLWPEISLWMGRSPFLTRTFQWTKTRVVARECPDTWFATARTWPKTADAEQQANTLAGIHAEYVLFVLDESGGIPQAVMTTAEAVLATGKVCKVVQAGNPTHTTGPLYRACTTDRHLWHVITITGDPDNPKRSPRVSLQWAQQQIEAWGKDSPWNRVNVYGEFPEASINSLLGVEEVERAMRRHLPTDAYDWAQKRIGVDVARFGDDRTVIFPRQGLAAFRPIIMRHERTTAIAARVARGHTQWGNELIFVDDTGHWGHGVIDNLMTAGYPVIPLTYSDKALNPRYRNRRCEFWMEGADWVKKGGALPHIPEMVAELTEPTYTFVGGRFVLEEKDQIKERLGRSPDLADALFETFALPDQPAGVLQQLKGRQTVRTEFDPYAVDDQASEGRAETSFNPFSTDRDGL